MPFLFKNYLQKSHIFWLDYIRLSPSWGKKNWLEMMQRTKAQTLEAVVQRCSVKNVFLEISQNSQKNTCARVSFLIKASGLQPSVLSTPLFMWKF